jgi:phosphatidylglycerophosphatase A
MNESNPGPRAGFVSWALATWFGCGLVPVAPGTVGALGAIPLYLLVIRGGKPALLAAAVGVTAAGIWAASRVARELGKKDPQLVVVDEVAGMLVTMLPVTAVTPRAIVAGFVLFRVLDIVKPWPVRSIEKLPGGWGIVLDDVAAGVLGAIGLVLLEVARVVP